MCYLVSFLGSNLAICTCITQLKKLFISNSKLTRRPWTMVKECTSSSAPDICALDARYCARQMWSVADAYSCHVYGLGLVAGIGPRGQLLWAIRRALDWIGSPIDGETIKKRRNWNRQTVKIASLAYYHFLYRQKKFVRKNISNGNLELRYFWENLNAYQKSPKQGT